MHTIFPIFLPRFSCNKLHLIQPVISRCKQSQYWIAFALVQISHIPLLLMHVNNSARTNCSTQHMQKKVGGRKLFPARESTHLKMKSKYCSNNKASDAADDGCWRIFCWGWNDFLLHVPEMEAFCFCVCTKGFLKASIVWKRKYGKQKV